MTPKSIPKKPKTVDVGPKDTQRDSKGTQKDNARAILAQKAPKAPKRSQRCKAYLDKLPINRPSGRCYVARMRERCYNVMWNLLIHAHRSLSQYFEIQSIIETVQSHPII